MILNKKNNKKSSYLTTDDNRLLLKMVTSYSIFLLIILIMGIFLYTFAIKNIKSRFQSQSNSLLSSSIQLLDQDFQIMEVFSRQLLQNPNFWSVTDCTNNTEPAFLANGLALRNYLATSIYPDTLLPISDFYIHFENSKQILSPNVFTSQSMFYTGIKHYKQEEYNTWVEQLLDSASYNKMLIMDPFYTVPTNHFYFYTIDFDTLTYRSSNATITFIIDEQEVAERFQELDFYGNGFLVTCDENGKIMFTLSEWNKDHTVTPPVINVDTLHNLTFTGDYASARINDTPMLVTKSVSAENGWYYYLIQPEKAAYTGMNWYRYLYPVTLLLALLAGCNLIIFLSKRNIAPIVELGAELQVVSEEKSILQEVVDKQKPIIINSYIQKLLNGSISSDDEMLYIKNYLEWNEDDLHHNVVYVVAYNNSENGGESTCGNFDLQNPEDFENIMSSAIRKCFKEPYYSYSPSDRTYALLLSCKKEDADHLIMRVQERIVKLHEYLLDTYGIWMFAGIGHTTDSLMNVWECYQQALEAVNYTTNNYIFFPYEIIKKDSNAFYYPPELSAKLIHFISTGNKPQVLELFGLIHHENIEERSLPVNLLQFLMQDIRNTLLKARFALPAGTDNAVISALDERFNEHLSFKLCEDLALSLCDLFQAGMKDTNLAATIEKYIIDNYKDSSLCLNKISDKFQISESYFSHMFKEKTGVNFSVYLENIRMNEAARLVRDANINLGELYIHVGYNNPVTFRRAFKKIYGVTPSSMRENSITIS